MNGNAARDAGGRRLRWRRCLGVDPEEETSAKAKNKNDGVTWEANHKTVTRTQDYEEGQIILNEWCRDNCCNDNQPLGKVVAVPA